MYTNIKMMLFVLFCGNSQIPRISVLKKLETLNIFLVA